MFSCYLVTMLAFIRCSMPSLLGLSGMFTLNCFIPQCLMLLKDTSTIVNYNLHVGLLSVVTFNIIISTGSLFIISKTSFGKHMYSSKFVFRHKIVYLLLLNLPFFIIRLVAWHINDLNFSAFLIKNI